MTPYHTAGNGQCGHFNRTLHSLLRALPASRKRDWVVCLPQDLFRYNTNLHQATDESPHFLMFGKEPWLPVDFLLGKLQEPVAGGVHEWVQEHQNRLQVTFSGAQGRLKVMAEKLCPVQALDAYVHRAVLWRNNEQLFVCFGPPNKGSPAPCKGWASGWSRPSHLLMSRSVNLPLWLSGPTRPGGWRPPRP